MDTCQHVTWNPIDPVFDFGEDVVTVTWTHAECAACGSVRDKPVALPGETFTFYTSDALLSDAATQQAGEPQKIIELSGRAGGRGGAKTGR